MEVMASSRDVFRGMKPASRTWVFASVFEKWIGVVMRRRWNSVMAYLPTTGRWLAAMARLSFQGGSSGTERRS